LGEFLDFVVANAGSKSFDSIKIKMLRETSEPRVRKNPGTSKGGTVPWHPRCNAHPNDGRAGLRGAVYLYPRNGPWQKGKGVKCEFVEKGEGRVMGYWIHGCFDSKWLEPPENGFEHRT